jgi:hypothetical protein
MRPLAPLSAITRIVALSAAFTFIGAAAGAAQSPARATIHVTAHDSSGAPVTDAELTVTRGLRDVLAHGTTDSLGQARLIVAGLSEPTDLEVVMRKIGYARGDQFFTTNPRDLVDLTIIVARPKPTLAAVKVTARTDPKWKSYHLSADDIANADMPLSDGWDVIKRLAPDMLTSRGGCATGAQEVWVNGKRIRLPLRPIGMAAARARVGVPFRARFSYVPVSVLSDIAPEHIEEVLYHDCFDASMAAVGSDNAIFVTLKPGVAYVQDVGSFVLDSVGTRRGAP